MTLTEEQKQPLGEALSKWFGDIDFAEDENEEGQLMNRTRGLLSIFDYCDSRNIDDLIERIILPHLAAPVAEGDAPDHADDIAIDVFARVMKTKMAEQRAKGYDGWTGCGYQVLSNLLHRCVAKGDPRDVAIVAMMLWSHESQIVPATDAWQPIASAPRDGSTIMLRFGEDGVSQGRYSHVPTNPGYPWVFIDSQGEDRWIINRAVDALGGPSHWMPMPGA
jgi:hypothetical protein